jgi:prepilin-type N-terminal cleavage/methylation domain-containing protein/prepilin-type processing-associated H-X9-DG protein
MKYYRKIKGFTLIEILVCVAILAILSAIIFSIYFKQREKSRSSVCISNMKNFSISLRMYIDDYDGYWPTHNGAIGLNNKNHQLKCPDFNKKYSSLSEIRFTGYSFNGGFIGLPPVKPSIHETNIRYPQMTVAIAEVNSAETIETAWTNDYEKGIRHNGGGNFVFCDGHTKWYLPKAVSGIDELRAVDGTFPSFANQSERQPVAQNPNSE